MDDFSSSGQLDEARQAILLGHSDHATNLLTVHLASAPDDAEAWWLLATASADESQRRRALLNRLRLRPDDARAWRMFNNMGVRPVTSGFQPLTPPFPRRAGGQPPSLFFTALAPPVSPRLPDLRRRRPTMLERTRRPSWVYWVLLAATACGVFGCGLLCFTVVLAGMTLGGRLGVGQLQSSAPPASRPGAPMIALRSRLRYSEWRTGQIDQPDQLDGYNFDGHRDEVISVQVVADSMLTLRPRLGLYGPDQTQIAAASSDEALTARLSLILPANGQFIIVVTGQGASVGAYRVMLWRTDSAAVFERPALRAG